MLYNRRRMSYSKKNIRKTAICATVIGLVTMMSGCSNKQEKTDNVYYVKTTKVETVGELSSLTYPGKTRSAEQVNVAFRVSGPINRVYVKEGDYVRKGGLIAEMDNRDYKVQLSATQAEYELVKSDAERVIALWNEGNTTASNYDKARYGLQQITEKLANHRNQLADTKLYAPISGYVQQKMHEAGETVAAGMPVVSMFSNSDPEIEIFVPVSDYTRRDDLVKASCSFDVIPGESFPLVVSSYSKEANASQLYAVRLKIKGNYDKSKITPGMTTMVYVDYRTLGEGAGSSVMNKIPASAVLHVGEENIVYVLNEKTGIIKKRIVTIVRLDMHGNALISEGLETGEIVVCAGVRNLKDGEKVKELPKTSKDNVGGLL